MGALLNLDAHEAVAQLLESEAVRNRVCAHPGRAGDGDSETGTSRLCEDVRSVGNHERFAEISPDFLQEGRRGGKRSEEGEDGTLFF